MMKFAYEVFFGSKNKSDHESNFFQKRKKHPTSWRLSYPSENIFVKLDHETPSFGVKIKNCLPLSPIYNHGSVENVCLENDFSLQGSHVPTMIMGGRRKGVKHPPSQLFEGFSELTLPKTNSSPLKIGHPKRKGSSSNHPFFRSLRFLTEQVNTPEKWRPSLLPQRKGKFHLPVP